CGACCHQGFQKPFAGRSSCAPCPPRCSQRQQMLDRLAKYFDAESVFAVSGDGPKPDKCFGAVGEKTIQNRSQIAGRASFGAGRTVSSFVPSSVIAAQSGKSIPAVTCDA